MCIRNSNLLQWIRIDVQIEISKGIWKELFIQCAVNLPQQRFAWIGEKVSIVIDKTLNKDKKSCKFWKLF